MTKEHKLSLSTAVLINLNIILGAGIFINTVELAKRAGMLGGFSYALMGLLMLPLILSIAMLLRIHPGGNFYTFAKEEINPFAGFMSSWSYFTGKLGASAIMIHSSVLFLQQIMPGLRAFNPFTIDFAILGTFIALNMLNIKAGGQIQVVFTTFKMATIFSTIFIGLYLFDSSYFDVEHIKWSGIISSFPLLIYASLGFEAICALSSKMENPQKNAPRAVLISYSIMMLVIVLFQVCLYGAVGNELVAAQDYRFAFPALVGKFLPNDPLLMKKLIGLFHIGIAVSALSGSYGVIFSNAWNLYELAKNKHVWFSSIITRLNRHLIPFVCVLVEGFIIGMYLLISGGNQLPLQQLSALGCVIAYTLSVFALLQAKRNRSYIPVGMWVPFLGMINCVVLIGACIKGFVDKGFTSLLAFMALSLIGCMMFFSTKKNRTVKV